MMSFSGSPPARNRLKEEHIVVTEPTANIDVLGHKPYRALFPIERPAAFGSASEIANPHPALEPFQNFSLSFQAHCWEYPHPWLSSAYPLNRSLPKNSPR
jgi:hypothetical protein